MSFMEILAGIISGVLGGMGLGGGGALILYLTIFADVSQITAQGINLMFFIPSGIIAIIIYLKRGAIKLKPLIPYILGGVAGSVLGLLLSSAIGGGLLQKLFGVGILIMGVREIFYKERS